MRRRLHSNRSRCCRLREREAQRTGGPRSFPRHRRTGNEAIVRRSIGGVDRATRPAPSDDAMFASYAQLANNLLQHVTGICLLDSRLRVRGQTGDLKIEAIAKSLRGLGWTGTMQRVASVIAQAGGDWLA